ncbi:hypothetical protein ABE237_21335 [Brevibacillus formosus]|uniref:hypothetical protein n=1 Tax=Brevibacillus formosus TaxID=54913 RepID=UPI0018CF3214|nr:hypothetical protein [Brevibacillus formosus]MBG9941004.1 hypothetical protein [Brevibacillus formosus]
MSRGKKLPPILVAASEFENMKWLALWGPESNILPGPKVRDTVRHAIQSTAKGATEERIFAHLGWVKLDEGWKYLHAGGAVGACADKHQSILTLEKKWKKTWDSGWRGLRSFMGGLFQML